MKVCSLCHAHLKGKLLDHLYEKHLEYTRMLSEELFYLDDEAIERRFKNVGIELIIDSKDFYKV